MCFRPKKLKKHKNMTFFLNLKIVNSCCRLTKELTNFSFYVHQYDESKRLFKILFCVLKSKKNRPFVHQGNIRCTKDGTRPKDVLKDKYDLTRRMQRTGLFSRRSVVQNFVWIRNRRMDGRIRAFRS